MVSTFFIVLIADSKYYLFLSFNYFGISLVEKQIKVNAL